MASPIMPGTLRPSLMKSPEHLSGQEDLEHAAREFEGLLLTELMKSMRKTVQKSELMGESFGQDTFTEMLDGELTKRIAESGGLGLHRILVEQLSGGTQVVDQGSDEGRDSVSLRPPHLGSQGNNKGNP